MNSKSCYSSEKEEKREEMLLKFHDFQRKAEMYYIYHSIQRYTVSNSIGGKQLDVMYINCKFLDERSIGESSNSTADIV